MNNLKECPLISVIICTRNEAENLPYVLHKIPHWVHEILLVDAHSTDDTVTVAQKLCSRISILYQPGTGKADAIKYGVNKAKGEFIVTLDADGETPPEVIESFITPLLDGYSFVKGSRLCKRIPRKMLRYRWFGNKVLAFTCNILYGTHFSDICCGYNSWHVI
jgi:glycosyltransferase involved in cell wall biosynthesis